MTSRGVIVGQPESHQLPTGEQHLGSLSKRAVSKLSILLLLLLATGERVYSPICGTQWDQGLQYLERLTGYVPRYRELLVAYLLTFISKWTRSLWQPATP